MILLKFKSILTETQKICRILHNITLECFLLQSVLCNDISASCYNEGIGENILWSISWQRPNLNLVLGCQKDLNSTDRV